MNLERINMLKLRYIFSVISVLALSCYSYGILAQESGLLAMGYQKLDNKEYGEAIDFFSQILNSEPSDSDALSGIIRASLRSNNLKNAQKHIETAISHYPNNPEFYLSEGILNNLKGDYSKAIVSLTKAAEITEGVPDPQIYINRGVAFLQKEEYEEAIEDFKDALVHNPRNATVLNYKAFASYRMGLYEEAVADYDKAIDLNPDNATAYYNRGMAHLRSNNKIKACPDFHRACSMGNKNACRMIMTECAAGFK